MSDYNSDSAVKEPAHDEFERYPFAKRIAQTILGSSSPDGFVIGIYGAWGEGKSSVLEFISSEIEASKSQDVVTIKFNPWRFGDEVMLLTTFFNEIANALGKKTHSWFERVAKVVKRNESVEKNRINMTK